MLRGLRVDTRRVAAVVAVAAIALALLGRSAFGTFRGAVEVTHLTTSGTLGLTATNGDPEQPAAILGTTPLPDPDNGFGFLPGSSSERLIDLAITGTIGFTELTVTAGPFTNPSDLTNDPDHGLQVKIERCSIPWQHAGGVAPHKTYACAGTTELVVDTSSYFGTKSLSAEPSDSLLEVGAVNHYRFTYTLPTTAPVSMADDAAVPVLTIFNGTQRAAEAK